MTNLDAPLVLTRCVLIVLRVLNRSSNCYSDWLGLSLHFYTLNYKNLGRSFSVIYIDAGLQESHSTKNYLHTWLNHTETLVCQKKICLGVHYSLLVFTQSNLGFVFTVKYICLNTKNKVPNSELLRHVTENLSRCTLFIACIHAEQLRFCLHCEICLFKYQKQSTKFRIVKTFHRNVGDKLTVVNETFY